MCTVPFLFGYKISVFINILNISHISHHCFIFNYVEFAFTFLRETKFGGDNHVSFPY